MDEETAHWLAFSVFPGIGPVRFNLLLSYFGSAIAAWNASTETLRTTGLPERLVDSFAQFKKTFSIDDYVRALEKQHISVLTLTHPRYPKLLKELSDAPFVLYVRAKPLTSKNNRGEVVSEKISLEKTIAVVGTRKATNYGKDVTKQIVRDLVASGCTIVSGMAYGIDAVAHETAIVEGGKTIAVLGCGVDIIAPPINKPIYDKLAYEGCGAVVSEMPLGLRPNKGLFPARNRIISGLSLGVVVIEGADDSGALITARNAADQGREVFAVPGPITSPGPAKLLKSGATLIESADDILAALGLAKGNINRNNRKSHTYIGETPAEQKIIALLSKEPVSIDTLVVTTGLTASDVAASITVLELHGIVKDIGERVYSLQ